jgi:uncharacterized membrane protein YraQ (UPF0718 family)
MTSIVLYCLAFVLLAVSALKDKGKTKKSLKIAWKSFTKMLPSVFAIMIFIGISLSILDKDMISYMIGSKSGILGIIFALITGSIVVMPSFIAFPLGGALINAGAGYAQVAALVSTVMAVGIVSLPMEIKYFNKAIAVRRVVFSFLICVIFTAVIGMVM